ncbi:hypothetical protein ACFU99_29800 [Streptomyces sp. NPDC057654]|uniref:hypothetical protein n=1 Tax=Streptomyces sp. NPDC057654 TaxID=3346196 RepID=UPI00367C775B
MPSDQKDMLAPKGRDLVLRVPRPSIRLSVRGGGIFFAIAFGYVQQPISVVALAALGIAGHCCDAVIARSSGRRSDAA